MIVFQILTTAFSMFWEVLWPLILGFTLSGVVQAIVSHKSLAKTLGDDSPKSLTFATLFGIASSSCSYAAVALAHSLFQKGASFTSTMVFEVASTNLVIELGIILVVLMGWQFMAAEFIGGILMVVIIALIFRLTLTPKLVSLAKQHADKGLLGRMEGHAAMDMSIAEKGTFWQRLLSKKGFTAVSEYFVMDWASVWVDIVLGFLIAGALEVLVPHSSDDELYPPLPNEPEKGEQVLDEEASIKAISGQPQTESVDTTPAGGRVNEDSDAKDDPVKPWQKAVLDFYAKQFDQLEKRRIDLENKAEARSALLKERALFAQNKRIFGKIALWQWDRKNKAAIQDDGVEEKLDSVVNEQEQLQTIQNAVQRGQSSVVEDDLQNRIRTAGLYLGNEALVIFKQVNPTKGAELEKELRIELLEKQTRQIVEAMLVEISTFSWADQVIRNSMIDTIQDAVYPAIAKLSHENATLAEQLLNKLNQKLEKSGTYGIPVLNNLPTLEDLQLELEEFPQKTKENRLERNIFTKKRLVSQIRSSIDDLQSAIENGDKNTFHEGRDETYKYITELRNLAPREAAILENQLNNLKI